jgi:MFS transporter, Spinster family, sphingosine-1-phosphate transporter
VAGYAFSIFLIHIFGDISSPVFIGVVSKAFGSPTVAGSPIGQFFASIGAWPVAGTNLTVGMLSVVPVLGLGAFFFLLGSRHLPADQERAVHASGGASEGAIFGH